MNIERIQEVTNDWRSANWKVIEFENPGFKEVRKLFLETYEIIEKYRDEKLVPKELSGLLLEMQEFSWWVSNLEETPLHRYHQEIVSMMYELKGMFLKKDADTQKVKNLIEKIPEENT